MPNNVFPLPPKVAKDLATKVKSGEYKAGLDYFRLTDKIYEFVRGTTVVTLMDVKSEQGHQKKDTNRANELKKLFADEKARLASLVQQGETK